MLSRCKQLLPLIAHGSRLTPANISPAVVSLQRHYANCPPVPALKPDIGFEELSKRCHTKELFIVDVRTPEEIEQLGLVPNSLHCEIKLFGDKFMLSEEAFLKEFGVPKPSADAEIVTTCKMGLRARTAQVALHGLGYTNVRTYAGSFDEWMLLGGPIVRTIMCSFTA